MAPYMPITLQGVSLGERHQYLNSLVAEAIKNGETIDTTLTEKPVDRLFKIELALKQRHVDYIIQNLKDEDMLYVSRALKAKWLLEDQYRAIINPDTLEKEIYPHMTLPAVNKMSHWIHLNLRDEQRCQVFYDHYSSKNQQLAIKYLLKSSIETIIKEFPKLLTSVTPHLFKMFCERTPLAAKLLYESIDSKSFRQKYVKNDREYFKSLKCVFKTNPDIYLDIIEKHFERKFGALSSAATRFVMTHKKERFLGKPELYTAWLLNVEEMASRLDAGECESLLVQLARSKFIQDWFNYKNCEPLIKRLDKTKRAEFKKRIFVQKELGEVVFDWPYPPPKPPGHEDGSANSSLWGSDDGYYDENDCPEWSFAEKCLKLERCGYSQQCNIKMPKTGLDTLFDEYRFKNFNTALPELSKKLLAESVPKHRMSMMLVLISKSGGDDANMEALLQLMMKHRNEPVHFRAALVRSMAKRAAVWRTSGDNWNTLMVYSEGLGLDGSDPEADCDEGIHAVVIRSLLSTGDIPPLIKKAFLKNSRLFSSLEGYALTKDEKQQVTTLLPKILLEYILEEKDIQTAASVMLLLLDTLKQYNMRADRYDGVLQAVKQLSERDMKVSERIFRRLFSDRTGRKELFKENFDIIQTDDSYVNALKHDASIIKIDKMLKSIETGKLGLDRFMSKTSIYFAEDGGLGSRLLAELKQTKTDEMMRPIAYLIGSDLKSFMLHLDEKSGEHKKDKKYKLCASLRANAHLAKPLFDLKEFTWKKAGIKMIANRILTCKSVDVDDFIEQSLTWTRSARIATVLAKRTTREMDVFEKVARMRPTIAVKIALKHIQQRETSDIRFWKVVKPFIGKYATMDNIPHLSKNFNGLCKVPRSIRPEYFMVLLPIFENQRKNTFLSHIETMVPHLDPQLIERVLMKYLDELKLSDPFERVTGAPFLSLKILAMYILSSKNKDEQDHRFTQFVEVFFTKIDALCSQDPEKSKQNRVKYLHDFVKFLISEDIFYDTRYVTSLPIFEKILAKIQAYPLEEYVACYIELKITICYYKAVHDTIKSNPELFRAEEPKSKGKNIVGERFGKYIAEDAGAFVQNNLHSVVNMYSEYILGDTRHTGIKYVSFIAKGIILNSKGIEGKIAVDLLRYAKRYEGDEACTHIKELMVQKLDQYSMFFYHDAENST